MSDATNNNETPQASEEVKTSTVPTETAAEAGLTAQAAVENEKEFEKKSKTPIIILIVVLVIAAIGVGAWAVISQSGGFYDNAAQNGQAPYKTDEEKQAELDRVVDEGMFNISIAAAVMMDSGSAPAELRIENVPGNRYLMKVDIVRDDTGERIYETDLIEPNHHIQTDTLDVSLPKGTYECTAIFSAHDPATEEQIGQAAAKMTIQVAN